MWRYVAKRLLDHAKPRSFGLSNQIQKHGGLLRAYTADCNPYLRSSTISLIPRANLPSFELQPTHVLSFSSVATSQVDGKDGNSDSSADSATTVTTSEEKFEPVQHEGSADEGKGNDHELGSETIEDDVTALLGEKLALLEEKDKELKVLKDKLLWSLAEMENVRERARRDAESTRKYAVQNFAKAMLDVADNMSRAAAAVPETLSTSSASDEVRGLEKQVQTFLQGLKMTEKQLFQVFKSHGLEKFDATGQPFDPTRHSALFEVPDSTKPSGTVAVVLKNSDRNSRRRLYSMY